MRGKRAKEFRRAVYGDSALLKVDVRPYGFLTIRGVGICVVNHPDGLRALYLAVKKAWPRRHR